MHTLAVKTPLLRSQEEKPYGTRARAMRSSHFCVKELRSKPKPPILDTTLKASARHPPEGKSR